MSEIVPSRTEKVDVDYIYQIRTVMNDLIQTNLDFFHNLQDHIILFDKKLKEYTKDKNGSTAWLQQVDKWQALVGGSIEEKEDISEDFYNDVSDKITNFTRQLREVIDDKRDIGDINYDF